MDAARNGQDSMVSASRTPSGTVVRVLVDRLDLDRAAEFQCRLTELLTDETQAARCVVVDLTDVQYVDSAGLGALVAAFRRAARGCLRVAGLHPRVAGVFRLTCLDRYIPVHGTVADALEGTAHTDGCAGMETR